MGEAAASESGSPAGDDGTTPAMAAAQTMAETRRRSSNPDLDRRRPPTARPTGRPRRLLTASVVAAIMTAAGIGAWLVSGDSSAPASDDEPLPVAVLAGASTTTTTASTTSASPTGTGDGTGAPASGAEGDTDTDTEVDAASPAASSSTSADPDAGDGAVTGAAGTASTSSSTTSLGTTSTSAPGAAGSVNCDEWYVPAQRELVAGYERTTTAAYNLRRAPLADNACRRDVIMPHGATIRITAERGDWRYIQDDLTGELGWVDISAFDPDNPTTSVPTPVCSEWFVPIRSDQVSVYEVTTTADYNVRRAPLADDACRRGQVLPAGSTVRILAERGPWRYMNHPLNNDLGWIHIDVIAD
ncbi:MAG: hypothetical protein AAGD35_05125 [Actinomycetota bacterium]